jgi:hypothetical protein
MSAWRGVLGMIFLMLAASVHAAPEAAITRIEPPEAGFFSKRLEVRGIPIKAHAVVSDAALLEARRRLERMLGRLPNAAANLADAGAELHVIGKDQVTSDLPEFRHLKGKPFQGKPTEKVQTIDERTRGMGGLLASCGEENLLKLPEDRYAGRDICIHEFAHNLQEHGLSANVQAMIERQYRESLAKGLWKGAYAASDKGEFFAELSMWYFGTHGDMGMAAPKPPPGPEGLRGYDPDAFALLDALYSGRLPVERRPGFRDAVKLRAYPPSQESAVRTAEAGPLTMVRFRNQTAGPLQLFWLPGDGTRKPYGEVAPGAVQAQSTYAGHWWLLATPDGKAVALFEAAARPGLAEVKP